MITKQEWVKFQTTGANEGANHQVIEFIANILFHNTDKVEDPLANYRAINELYCGGYCYYFACMLKEAFNRGDIYHPIAEDHIVWMDDDNRAYDIDGLVDCIAVDLVPITRFDDDFIQSYKHIPSNLNNEEEI